MSAVGHQRLQMPLIVPFGFDWRVCAPCEIMTPVFEC
jgi:hypothetical protein